MSAAIQQETIPLEVHEAYSPITNYTAFIDGMRDAKEGVPHKPEMTKEYDRGYGAQKELEAIMGSN